MFAKRISIFSIVKLRVMRVLIYVYVNFMLCVSYVCVMHMLCMCNFVINMCGLSYVQESEGLCTFYMCLYVYFII